VPGTTLLHGGNGGTGPRQHGPPSTSALATGQASSGGPGPGAPTGNSYPYAAQGPHRGLLHVRPGAYPPAAGPGTVADMGDPNSPPPIPPHRPCSTRTRRQGDEVLFDPAIPAQLPGGSYGPIERTDCSHTPAGGDSRPPDARPEQSRGTGDGCRLAPSLGPDCAAIRALLANGAPGQALQLLTSDGACDAPDPAALTRLRELHPQAEGPKLEPPFPEDRPDVAPS